MSFLPTSMVFQMLLWATERIAVLQAGELSAAAARAATSIATRRSR